MKCNNQFAKILLLFPFLVGCLFLPAETVGLAEPNSFYQSDVPIRPISLEDTIGWLNSQQDRFFVTGCRITEDGLLPIGAIPILISIKDAEYVFVYESDRDTTMPVATAVWRDGLIPGYFESDSGLWSHSFAFSIYEHLRGLPFVRRSVTSLTDILEVANYNICDFDFSSLR